MVVGVLLRMARWGAGRSLWLNEIVLTRRITAASGQPLGFIWLEKLGLTLWSASERGLRTLPLIAGCAALVMMWRVGLRLLGTWGAAAAVSILALLEPAIYDSSEVGTGSLDLLATLMILQAYLQYTDKRGTRRLPVLVGIGLAAMLFSLPAILILLAMGLVVVCEGKKPDWKLIGVGLAWAGFYASCRQSWPIAAEAGTGSANMVRTANAPLAWFGGYSTLWLTLPGKWESAGAVMGFMAAVIGWFLLLQRQGWRIALLLASPIALSLAAVFAGYSQPQTKAMFLVPLLVLCMASVVHIRKDRALAITGSILLSMAMLTSAGRAAQYLVNPPGREEIRTVIEHLARDVHPGDEIYVYYGAQPGWEWYGSSHVWTGVTIVTGTDRDKEFAAFDRDLAKMHGRVWLLFSHMPTGMSQDQRLTQLLDNRAKLLKQIEARGAGAYLYELN